MPGHRQWLAGAAGDAVGLAGRRHELRLLWQAVTLRRPVLLGPASARYDDLSVRVQAPLAGQGKDVTTR